MLAIQRINHIMWESSNVLNPIAASGLGLFVNSYSTVDRNSAQLNISTTGLHRE